MIRIRRGPAPPSLRVYCGRPAANGGPLTTPAQQETTSATAFFTDPANYANEQKLSKKSFTFRAYKDPELTAALEVVFDKKCAYCESRFAHVTPKDIEHFRPKSEINTGSTKLIPGYYWLAGDWDNLLVSCPDCNRGRWFEVPGQPERVKLGKATQFPLRREAGRIRCADPGIASEEPLRLLIDPCRDYPERHLIFDDEALVHPRLDSRSKASKKGEASIFAYALQRKDLVEERKRVLNRLIWLVNQLGRSTQDMSDFMAARNQVAVDRKRRELVEIKGEIRLMLAKGAPYLGMLRGWIRGQRQAGEFAQLEKAGIRLEQFL